MRERSPLKVVICANEERGGGKTCVEGRELSGHDIFKTFISTNSALIC